MFKINRLNILLLSAYVVICFSSFHNFGIEQNQTIRIPISLHQEHLSAAVLPLGIPLDRDKLNNISGYHAVLISDGREYGTSGLKIKNTYQNGSIKWLHTEIKTNNNIKSAKENFIELRPRKGPDLTNKITVSENNTSITINNGVFTVVFEKSHPLPASIKMASGTTINFNEKTMALEDTIRGKSNLGGNASKLKWQILRQSDLRVVLFAEGYYNSGREDVAKARLWYEIKEGMPFIDFNHTLINIHHNIAYKNLGFALNIGNDGDIYVKDEEKQETIKRSRQGNSVTVKLLDNQLIDYEWKTIYQAVPDYWFKGWNTTREEKIKKSEKPHGHSMSPIGVARTHEMRIAMNRNGILFNDLNTKAYTIAAPEYITKLNEHVWPVMATKAEGEKNFPNLERLITGFWSDYMLMDILVPNKGWYFYGRWNWPGHVIIRENKKEKNSPVVYGPHPNHIGSSQYGLHEHCLYAASRTNSREIMDYVLTSNRFVRDFRYCSYSGMYESSGGDRVRKFQRIEGAFLNGFDGETIFAFAANPNKPFSSGENSELISPLLIEYYLFDNVENELIIKTFSSALVKYLDEMYPINGSITEKVKIVKFNLAGDGNEMNTLKAWIKAYELSKDKSILKYVDDLFMRIMDESGNWGASEKYWKAIAPDDKKGYNETYKAHMATNNGYSIFLVTEDKKYRDRIIKAWLTEEGGQVYKDIKSGCLQNGHMQYQGRYPLAMSRVIKANLSPKSVSWAINEVRWYMNDFENAAQVINEVRKNAGLDGPDGFKKRPGSAIFNVPTDKLKLATGKSYERYIYRCGSAAQTPLMLYSLPVGMQVLIENGR